MKSIERSRSTSSFECDPLNRAYREVTKAYNARALCIRLALKDYVHQHWWTTVCTNCWRPHPYASKHQFTTRKPNIPMIAKSVDSILSPYWDQTHSRDSKTPEDRLSDLRLTRSKVSSYYKSYHKTESRKAICMTLHFTLFVEHKDSRGVLLIWKPRFQRTLYVQLNYYKNLGGHSDANHMPWKVLAFFITIQMEQNCHVATHEQNCSQIWTKLRRETTVAKSNFLL